MRPSASGKIRSARTLSARRSASCGAVLVRDAEQHEQPRADRAHRLLLDGDRGALHALDERAHRAQPSPGRRCRVRRAMFTANDRAYREPERPVLAICADGWDPDYVDDALGRGLMPAACRGPLRRRRDLRSRPRAGADVHQPQQRRDRHRGERGTQRRGRQPLPRRRRRRGPGHRSALPAAPRRSTPPRRPRGSAALCVTAKDKLRRLLATGGVPSFSAERAHEQALPDGRAVHRLVGAPAQASTTGSSRPYTVDLATRAVARELGSRLAVRIADGLRPAQGPARGGAQRPLLPGDGRALGAALGRRLRRRAGTPTTACARRRCPTAADVRSLDDALRAAGIASSQTVLPITDPYVVHHAALGSFAWVHVDARPNATRRARRWPGSGRGRGACSPPTRRRGSIEQPEDRIGDLVRARRRRDGARHRRGARPLAVGSTLRSHGGLHERTVPLIVCSPLGDGALPGDLGNRDLHDLLLNRAAAR